MGAYSSVDCIRQHSLALLSPFLRRAVLQLKLLFILKSEDGLRRGVCKSLEHGWDCAQAEKWN